MRHSIDELKQVSYDVRKRFLELFSSLGFGHVTSAFSWADIAVVLYYEIMNCSKTPKTDERADRMVISKGHGMGILCPIFEGLGYFSTEEMEEILRIGGDSKQLNALYYPGFDFYGGALGIGLGVACGLAKADKMNGSSKKTYCIVGDAECYEGAIWEAAMFAAHQQLSNMVVIVDRNGLGCSDFTEHMLALEPFAEKWKACGWDITEMDGHNVEKIYNALSKAKNADSLRPQCIIANTKKGQGLEYLIDRPLMHGYVPKSADEIKRAFEELR